MSKITKLCLNLSKLCLEYSDSFFWKWYQFPTALDDVCCIQEAYPACKNLMQHCIHNGFIVDKCRLVVGDV